MDAPNVSFLSMSSSDPATDSGEGDHGGQDQEKKIRREIANSNERRRMQSINSGFQSLRTLLPHHEGEKLSKAAILQQTAEYIYSLEQEKTRLLAQNCHLKRLLSLSQQHLDSAQENSGGTEAKRKRAKADPKESDSPIETRPVLTSVTSVERDEATPAPIETEIYLPPAVIKEEKVSVEKLLSSETCRIIVSDNCVGSDTLVVPIPNSEETLKDESNEDVAGARSYIVTSTSKQNLDSIVEAIKHLEGDHLFSEEVRVPQEVVQEEIVEYSLSDENQATVSVQKENSIIIFKHCN